MGRAPRSLPPPASPAAAVASPPAPSMPILLLTLMSTATIVALPLPPSAVAFAPPPGPSSAGLAPLVDRRGVGVAVGLGGAAFGAGAGIRNGMGTAAAAAFPPPPSSSSPRASSSSSSTALFGIPKMFRWLTDQYPSINRRLSEGLTPDVVVDAFYLDMNGIIHPCTHGNSNDEIVVLDEAAMFRKIFGYVDRLYRIVRPRTVLYLAVDGVAPRAKMNQQRARRFRSSREAEDLAATILARDGALPEGTKFDSNCITPGTDFMLKLGIATRRWIEYKQESDPFWRDGADVVFTGPDVPGEGEHKVMDYLRHVRSMYDPDDPAMSHPHYRPGMTHVLYGLDADLIMLGLVTHEPNFMLLREKMSVVMAGRGRHRRRKRKDMLEYTRDDFELLELRALRQMFQIQFRRFADREALRPPPTDEASDAVEAEALRAVRSRKKFQYDPSRVIDDFVFMCMLVGNDFLPHCPHLDIDGGALSLMLNTYVDLLPAWGGYLTQADKIHPHRFEQFVYHVAAFEEEHFRRRGYEENEPGWALSSENEADAHDFYGTWYGGGPTPECARAENRRPTEGRGGDDGGVNGDADGGIPTDGASASGVAAAEAAAKAEAAEEDKTERKFRRKHPTDTSRSYRDYYYETKLGWYPHDRARTLRKRRAHVRDYMEGLHWVLHYYHKGCPSWDWYFPHLYSPLATDMVNLAEFYYEDDDDAHDDTDDDGFRTLSFAQTEPFPSLAQLLSVLPPQSADLLPPPLAELMVEPSSPLAQYYPREFTSDPNGKRQPWEAVVRIPFIDGEELLDVVKSIVDADEADGGGTAGMEPILTEAERRRNGRGTSHTFVPSRTGFDGTGANGERTGGEYAAAADAAVATAADAGGERRRRGRGRPAGRGAGRGGGGGRGRGRGRGGRGGRGGGRGGGGGRDMR